MPAASFPDVDDAQTTLAAGTPSLLERVSSALGETKARGCIEAGHIIVHGQVATDPHRPTPHGQRW